MNKLNKQEINTDIVIIGSGITALTIAYYLTKANKNFIVIERDSSAGGVIKTFNESGFLYEMGPNSGVIANGATAQLLDDISENCNIQLAGANVKKRLVLKNKHWHPLPMNPIQALTTPLFSNFDKLKIPFEVFISKGKNPEETLASTVKRRLGKSFLNYAIDPFILGIYAGDPEQLITKYAFPKLYKLEQDYGSFIGGALKKKFQKEKKAKQASKAIFSSDKGLSSIVNSLYAASPKENFIFDVSEVCVSKISESVDTKFSVEFKKEGKNYLINSGKVISTVRASSLTNLFPFINNDDLQNIDSLPYAKVIEIALGFNKWTGVDIHAFGGLIPHHEKRNILGILFMSSLFTDRAPEHGALFSIFMGGVRNADVFSLSDDEIFNLIKKEFLELMSCKTFTPELFKILRHEEAIPQYDRKTKERLLAIKKIEKEYIGLTLAGNICDGIGLANRIQQGSNIAKTMVQEMKG